jgi:phosphoribosylformylglycinamidine (FGAM) synthase PurS component
MIYQIEISFKKGFGDKHGEHIKHEISELGVQGITAVKYSPVYKFDGNLSLQEAERISSRLLIDPITEEYSINPENSAKGRILMEIWLKKGVTDTVAESVAKAVKDIGINEPLNIKTGHKFVFKGKVSAAAIKQVARKLLYNPMIQECKLQY